MDYRVLTGDHLSELQRRKLAEVEAEHAALALDVRLAVMVGIESPELEAARAQLAMLEAQHAALVAWLDGAEPCDS